MIVRIERLAPGALAATPLELRGRVLLVARLLWAVLVAGAMFLFAASIPATYSQLSDPPADTQAQLAQAGVSVAVYATYLVVLGCAFAVVCCTVAALVIWHRPNDRIGLLASVYLVFLGLATPPPMQFVAKDYPALAVPAHFATFLFQFFLVGFFFLFPDGRFVPQWTRTPVVAAGLGLTVMFFLTGAAGAEYPPDWMGLMTLVGGVAGIGAQAYRYFRVSDQLQRQQTKWAVFGVSGAILTGIAFAFAGPLFPTLGRSETGSDLTGNTTITLASLFVPVTLGLAILRHRLWDIDIVINRTLVYGTLTAGLLALYLVVVSGLGAVVRTGGDLPVSLLATALVAVLFAPLRGYLQTAVSRLIYGHRDDPYRVLTRVGERVSAALAPEAALQAIAETVAHALKSPYAAITLRQAETSAPQVSHGAFEGAPLSLPLEYQGETVGELLIAPRGPGEEFSQADRRLLGDLARQIGPAAHAVRLAADLQHSRERLVTAREDERRRLRRDLHDGLGPQLAALTLKIETIRNRFAGEGELDAALVDLTARTQAAVTDIRRLVYALRPPVLDELGLLSALHHAAAQYSQQGDASVHVAVEAPEALPPLPAAVEVAAYRIVQEALANVVRHAEARICRLGISLDGMQQVLRLQIADDGTGLPDQRRVGLGLVSMRERAEELGGRCSIDSPPSGGTVVSVELPLPAGHPQDIAP